MGVSEANAKTRARKAKADSLRQTYEESCAIEKPEEPKQRRRLTGHPGNRQHDARDDAAGSADLVNTGSKQLMFPVTVKHPTPTGVNSVALSPDGATLATTR